MVSNNFEINNPIEKFVHTLLVFLKLQKSHLQNAQALVITTYVVMNLLCLWEKTNSFSSEL